PTMALGFMLSIWQRGMASWERLREVLLVTPTLTDGPLHPEAHITQGHISVRGLTVEVLGRKLLDDVTLDVPGGSTLAIVVRTGCGKSTLAEVIARFCEVPAGSVFFDDMDINQIPLSAVRRAVGYAPQEAFLFSTSIRENIELGRRDREDVSSDRKPSASAPS